MSHERRSPRRALSIAALAFLTAVASVAVAPVAQAQAFPPTAQYVQHAYQDLLDRDAEPAAVEFWSNFLDSGRPHLTFTSSLTSSREYHRLVVRDAYQEYLGRAPDGDGLRFWADLLDAGLAPRDLEANLVGSAEYVAAAGSAPAAWVRAVYRDVLERPAGDGEVAFWTSLLSDGISHPTVAAAILASSEHRGQQVIDAYDRMLGRTPEAAGLAGWTEFLASASEPMMLAHIAASPEYVARAEAGVQMLSAYFLLGALDPGEQPGIVPVARGVEPTPTVLTAAMEQLLAGPTTAETEARPAIRSEIPPGAELLGATVEDGVATIDLSAEFEQGDGTASMFGRLAQVVYTATAFPTVREVDIHIDGADRDSFSGEGILLDSYRTRQAFLGTGVVPDIFVDRPAYAGAVTDPLRIRGTTSAFEGTFTAVVVDADGRILAEAIVTATEPVAGVNGWRHFDVTIDYEVPTNQRGALIVQATSARTGELIDIREYPIRLAG